MKSFSVKVIVCGEKLFGKSFSPHPFSKTFGLYEKIKFGEEPEYRTGGAADKII